MTKPFTNSSEGIGYYAMRLAMTRTLAEENQLKVEYAALGLALVVTEVGGNTKRDFQEKSNRAIIGAAMGGNIIEKQAHEIHALLHAAEEAKRGVIVNISSESNLAVKVAIVRKGNWISVAIFGDSAIHPMTNHERCGLGVMNI